MNSISIAEKLWFEETMLGATLNYMSEKDPEGVLFRVGISFQSLEDCNKQLGKSSMLWTIRDGSLSIFGDSEQLSLTFCSSNGQFLQAGLSLYGQELTAFKRAIDAFAAKRRTYLN